MYSDQIVSTFVEAARCHGGTISPRTSPSVSAELEARLSFRLPHFYRKLIDSYEFLPFAIGLVEFFGAFGSRDDPDIECRLFRDPIFVSVLVPVRLFHFARPDTGSYDSVCVDLSTPRPIECRVVVLHHAAALC